MTNYPRNNTNSIITYCHIILSRLHSFPKSVMLLFSSFLTLVALCICIFVHTVGTFHVFDYFLGSVLWSYGLSFALLSDVVMVFHCKVTFDAFRSTRRTNEPQVQHSHCPFSSLLFFSSSLINSPLILYNIPASFQATRCASLHSCGDVHSGGSSGCVRRHESAERSRRDGATGAIVHIVPVALLSSCDLFYPIMTSSLPV